MWPLLLLHPQLSTMSSSSPDSISVDTSLDMEDNSSGCEDIVAEGGEQFGRLKHLTNWPPVDILFQDVTQTVPDVTVGEWVIEAAACCAGKGEWELKGWLTGKRSVEMTRWPYSSIETGTRSSQGIASSPKQSVLISSDNRVVLNCVDREGGRERAGETLDLLLVCCKWFLRGGSSLLSIIIIYWNICDFLKPSWI